MELWTGGGQQKVRRAVGLAVGRTCTFRSVMTVKRRTLVRAGVLVDSARALDRPRRLRLTRDIMAACAVAGETRLAVRLEIVSSGLADMAALRRAGHCTCSPKDP